MEPKHDGRLPVKALVSRKTDSAHVQWEIGKKEEATVRLTEIVKGSHNNNKSNASFYAVP